MDLFAVLTEGTSTTSTDPLAQNLVELYGLLPTVADDVDHIPFPSKLSVAARSQEPGSPLDRMKKA